MGGGKVGRNGDEDGEMEDGRWEMGVEAVI